MGRIKSKNVIFFFKKLNKLDLYSFILDKFNKLVIDNLFELKTKFEFNKQYKQKDVKKKWIDKDSNKKIIISLTSYPKRFSKLHLVLYSLLTQTLKPNKVILVLSKKEVKNENNLPIKITFLKNMGLEIKLVKENWKSYKKLIYTLKDYPDYNIVTVDDDIIYKKNFLKKIFLKHKEYPKDIICYRAHLIKKLNGNLSPYKEWMDYNKNKFYRGMNIFPTGVGGVLYPIDSLNKEVFNSKVFLSLCPTGDDIWFKAMSILNKTNCIRLNCSFPGTNISGTQNNALWKENVEHGKNDKQIGSVFKKYNLYKYLEEVR